MSRAPDADDGPQRFMRRWLTFDPTRPVRMKKMWTLIATILMFLIASALLAWRDVPASN